jgi:predicted RNase H-like HicB family nuclease
MKYNYTAVIVKEDKKFWAYIPDLSGVYGLGTTSLKAKASLIEALKLYIDDCRADGHRVPASHVSAVKIERVSLAA